MIDRPTGPGPSPTGPGPTSDGNQPTKAADRGEAERFDSLLKDGGKKKSGAADRSDAKKGTKSPDKGADAALRAGLSASKTAKGSPSLESGGQSGKGGVAIDPDPDDPSQTALQQDIGQAAIATPSAGDAILRGLQGATTSAEATPQAQSAQSRTAEIARSVTDRILVSDASLGDQEVRIQLKDSVLSQTEVRLNRAGGQLQVQLITTSESSNAFLIQNQDALQQQLNSRLKEDVRVEVRFDQQSSDGGQDSEGRSRQRRNLYDEYEDT